MSKPPQDENVSTRDLGFINEEWQRELVGRKYVKHEDDGFNDLEVYSRPFSMASIVNNIISSSLQECQQ